MKKYILIITILSFKAKCMHTKLPIANTSALINNQSQPLHTATQTNNQNIKFQHIFNHFQNMENIKDSCYIFGTGIIMIAVFIPILWLYNNHQQLF